MMRGARNALFNGRMEIHNYQRRLEYWQKRIGKEKHADKALAFISHLKTKGLSDGRVCAYASRVPKLQRTLAEMDLELKKIDSVKAEKILAELLKDWMKGSTKQQYHEYMHHMWKIMHYKYYVRIPYLYRNIP